jgi:hypothetical protein
MAKTSSAPTASKKAPGGKGAVAKDKQPAKPVKKGVTTKAQFEAPSKKKTPAGLIVIPILSLVLFLWVLLLKLDIFPAFYFKSDNQGPVYIGALLQLVLLVVLAVAYSSKTKYEEEEIAELKRTYVSPEERVGNTKTGGEVDGEELVEVETEEQMEEEEMAAPPLKTAPETLIDKEQGIIEYPPQITGGVYSDTLIPVGSRKLLKLRTIIARSCIICDKQMECWPKARRYVSKEDFKTNIECKGGLRRLGVKDI